MNILIIGNGGREAAIAHFLQSNSNKSHQIHVSPHMQVMHTVISSQILPKEHQKILEYVIHNKIKLVIVGPELPLWEGLSDFLRSHNILVFGPSKDGAELECSKLSCKNFLVRAGIPTSPYEEIFSKEELLEKSHLFQPPWIVKADGLAAGKGVYICKTKNELETAAEDIFVQKKLGQQRAFLENFLPGKELSYLILTNGADFQTLPIAQDHKRIFDHDEGPNTGGMGTVAPLIISEPLHKKIEDQILKPFLKQISEDKILYRGVVFFGIMVDADENPFVLEINARFGDPETQVLLPLLSNDAADLFLEIAKGNLPKLQIKPGYASCVVLAAPGYPENPKKGLAITGDLNVSSKNSYYLAAGVSQSNKNYVTSGGRVLNSIGLGQTAEESLKNAYELAHKIHWDNIHFRKDIGQKVLQDKIFRF